MPKERVSWPVSDLENQTANHYGLMIRDYAFELLTCGLPPAYVADMLRKIATEVEKPVKPASWRAIAVMLLSNPHLMKVPRHEAEKVITKMTRPHSRGAFLKAFDRAYRLVKWLNARRYGTPLMQLLEVPGQLSPEERERRSLLARLQTIVRQRQGPGQKLPPNLSLP